MRGWGGRLLSPLWERLQNRELSPIRAKPQILLVRGSVLRARRTDPLTCDFRCLGGLRSPNSSLSLRAASRSGLRPLKSIHWIDFWPPATAPKSPPPRGRWAARLRPALSPHSELNCQKPQASPPVGIAPSGDGHACLGRGARSNLSKVCMWLLPAPRSAFFPAACVSLARRRRSSSSSSSGLTRG